MPGRVWPEANDVVALILDHFLVLLLDREDAPDAYVPGDRFTLEFEVALA